MMRIQINNFYQKIKSFINYKIDENSYKHKLTKNRSARCLACATRASMLRYSNRFKRRAFHACGREMLG